MPLHIYKFSDTAIKAKTRNPHLKFYPLQLSIRFNTTEQYRFLQYLVCEGVNQQVDVTHGKIHIFLAHGHTDKRTATRIKHKVTALEINYTKHKLIKFFFTTLGPFNTPKFSEAARNNDDDDDNILVIIINFF